MKLLLIGSGGREHTLALKIKESPKCKTLYIAPGNAGTAECGENINIPQTDIQALLAFAKEKNIDLTIVGPEDPLSLGITDLFQKHNLPIIGPNQKAAQLESSKKWSKELMKNYHIPTAEYKAFTDPEDALTYTKNKSHYPIVIKADGLAAGKGVTIAQNETDATRAINDCLRKNKFSKAGSQIIIEDFLEGEEASIFAFCDGKTILPMSPAQDHKAIYEGDKGPNTGGMGAYSPAPIVTNEIEEDVYNTIFLPLLKGFQKENIIYKGIVYAGLMIKDNKATIVEFNARFGDPETQVVIPRLENDIIDIFLAIHNQTLDTQTLKWKPDHAVCVVLASKGYPNAYEKNIPIQGLNTHSENSLIIHAGTKKENNQILSNGGRVLGVVGLGPTLQQAVQTSYNAINNISFTNNYYRKDIAQKGLHKLNTTNV